MKKADDRYYLIYRKLKAAGTHMVYLLLGLLPADRKKVVFCSIEGQCGFSCNPRYIAEEIIKRKRDYRLVWLVNDLGKQFPPEITKVKNTFFNRAYHLATAGVWVDNSRKPYGTRKKRSQLYMQTWHATLAFKAVGRLRADFPRIAYLISKRDSEMADYVLTDSEWCDRLYPDMLLTCGNTLRIGAPRCDILFNRREEMYRTLREKYRLSADARILLYAPTFRGGSQKKKREIFAEKTSLDLLRLRRTLEKIWEGEWYIFVRLHPQLSARSLRFEDGPEEHIRDVSGEDDMNAILAGTDVFITDYSSAAFDAGFIDIPVFIYADDMEEYVKDRGSLMWDMERLPFPFAGNNEQLEERIRNFDEDSYRKELRKLFQEVKLLEDGHASERAVNLIEDFMEHEGRGRPGRNKTENGERR